MIRSNRRRSCALQREALDQLMNATSGRASMADLGRLEAWRGRSPAHGEAYRRALGVWQALEAAGREAATAEDRALITGPPPPAAWSSAAQAAIGRRALLGGGLAAAAAAFGAVMIVRPPLGLWPSLADLTADYHTAVGERRKIALAEGVAVEMNTRTSIGIRPAAEGRAIELIAGEAAVSAACSEQQPFVVLAGAGQARAARARFDIRHDGGLVCVTCLDGTVEVAHGGAQAKLLPSQQAAYSDRGLGPIATVDPALVTAWQQGLLIFRDQPLAEVIGEVNRYWSGRIILLDSGLGRRRVTARIELARIGEVIAYVRTVLGAEVRTLPGGIILLS